MIRHCRKSTGTNSINDGSVLFKCSCNAVFASYHLDPYLFSHSHILQHNLKTSPNLVAEASGRTRDADGICDRRGQKKRAVAGPFRAGLRGENGAKHLNLDNSPAKQLAPAPLADSPRLDICSHFCRSPLHKVDVSS